MINIDDLTIGQLRQIQAMAGGAQPCASRTVQAGRAVVVVDRGWIFAGDMGVTADGYLRLDRAVHVFGWQSIGFARAVREWNTDKVDLRPCDPVELPMDAVIFRVPVSSDWGLR